MSIIVDLRVVHNFNRFRSLAIIFHLGAKSRMFVAAFSLALVSNICVSLAHGGADDETDFLYLAV